jgi:hypothetical protein
MKQRPFFFPLERCDSFGTFEPAENAVWADRLTVFCADVLQYYHGSAGYPQRRPKEPWMVLCATEKRWTEVLPTSFEPIYYREPDVTTGGVFRSSGMWPTTTSPGCNMSSWRAPGLRLRPECPEAWGRTCGGAEADVEHSHDDCAKGVRDCVE